MSLDVLYLAWNRLEMTRYTFRLLVQNTNWALADRLVVYDNGSTDGTREWLDANLDACPVPHVFRRAALRSPVLTMNHYFGEQPLDVFAKVDNDIAVPPGWLDEMTATLHDHPDVELLGMEAGQTRLDTEFTGSRWVTPCSHIGGVGLMRVSAFRSRPPVRPYGQRFGFTEWQHQYEPVRGWITPDLLVPQLDRIPLDPWMSLSDLYHERRWQRRWPRMSHRWAHGYYDWLPSALEPEEAVA